MKKIFTVLFFSFFLTIANACEICGCGVGNFNPYMFPHLSRNFISIGWQYHQYHTRVFEHNRYFLNKEYYNTISITAQYSPAKNLQLMAMLPYQVNKQIDHHGVNKLNRTGDVIFLANYKLYDNSNCNTKSRLMQSLIIGGGIKLPTGKYEYDGTNKNEVDNANFQAGTGSTDFIVNAFYSLRYGKLAFSSGINYKLNGINKDDYRFGNRLQTVTQVKYIVELGKYSFIPSAGIMTEKLAQDKENGLIVDDGRTGGYNTQALLGLDLNTRKWALGMNYSASVKQNLAAGRIHSKPGFSIHLSYSL